MQKREGRKQQIGLVLHKRKGQASMEYLLVAGIAFVIIVPMMFLLYDYIIGVSSEARSSRVSKIATDIVNAAEQVYYLGEPSKATIRVDLPQGVWDANVSEDTTLSFFLGDYQDSEEIVTFSRVRLKSYLTRLDLSQGRHDYHVEAEKDDVMIYTGNKSSAMALWCAYNTAEQIMRGGETALRAQKDAYSTVEAQCLFKSITIDGYTNIVFEIAESAAADSPVTEITVQSDVPLEIFDGMALAESLNTGVAIGLDFIYMTTEGSTPDVPAALAKIELAGDCIDNDLDDYGIVLNSPKCANLGYDCDDSKEAIHPDADEICGDSIDQDCNGADIPCGAAICGDGTVQAGEGCDDSNSIDGDGCSAACVIELP